MSEKEQAPPAPPECQICNFWDKTVPEKVSPARIYGIPHIPDGTVMVVCDLCAKVFGRRYVP